MKKLLGIVVLGLLLNVKSFAQESCGDFIEFSWWYAGDDGISKISKEDNPGWARFEFKSTSDKDITITRLYLFTADDKEVVNTSRNVFIRSFGKAHSMMFSLATLNLDVVKTASYSCKFGKQSDQAFQKNLEKDWGVKLNWDKKSNGTNTAIAWILGLAFILVVGYLWYDAQNSPQKKNTVKKYREEKKYSDTNLIEKVWNGKETMTKTFWLYCILFVGVVSFISGIFLASFGIVGFLIPGAVIIWSNTGLWRSSSIYQNHKLKSGQTYGWATAAKVYVVLNYLTTLSQIGLMIN